MTHTPGHAVLRLGKPPDPRRGLYRDNTKLFIEDLARYVSELARELEQYSDVNDRPAGDPYAVTNVVTDRSYDADATTTAELADILGTLIADLQDKGVIS